VPPSDTFQTPSRLIPDRRTTRRSLDLVNRISHWQRVLGPCKFAIFRRRSALFHSGVAIVLGLLACLPGQPVEAAQNSRVQVHTLTMRAKTPGIALDSVSCVDAAYCEAVGTVHAVNSWVPSNSDTPAIMHFNGRVWSESVTPRPSGAELHAIDCPKRGSCVAVGQVNGAPFIEELHGTTWSVVPVPSPNTYSQETGPNDDYSWLQAVSCRAVDECTAVGVDIGEGYPRGVEPDLALIEQQTQNGWQITSPVAPLVPTPMQGASGTITVPFNDLDAGFLLSVSCWKAGCAAVGDGESYVMRAGTWSPISPHLLLTSVSCTAAGCTAVGESNTPGANGTSGTIATLSGDTWSALPPFDSLAESSGLDSLSCPTIHSCVGVGGYTGLYTATKNRSGQLIDVQLKGHWRQFTMPAKSSRLDDNVTSVSCPSPRMCIGVGPGLVGHTIPTGPVHARAVRITPWFPDGSNRSSEVSHFAGYTGDPPPWASFLRSAFLSFSISAMTLKYSAWTAMHFGQR
jgi:hypothetical protein